MKKHFLLIFLIVAFIISTSFSSEEKILESYLKTFNSSQIIPFLDKKETFGHIFREEIGHFKEDTPENRAYIAAATSSPENYVSTNKFGVDMYLKVMPDGYQSWAQVYKGEITNGGCNKRILKWVSDETLPLGGKLVPIQYELLKPSIEEFATRLQFNKLIETYNSYHPLTPITERHVTKKASQGVEHQTGLILNLFEETSSFHEHAFFLPTPDDLLLKEEEIYQILAELATGIFFYDTIPFFSLHFNRDQGQYPVIHPAYQNTLAGYFISMLDYHMKGFINGLYFDEAFIKEWRKNRCFEESFLSKNAINLQEFCLKTLGCSYSTLPQLRKHFETEFQESLKIDVPQTSFRLIAKQDEIKLTHNLLTIGGNFDILFSLDPVEAASLSQKQLAIESHACEQMCLQIKNILPRLPFLKRHFQALNLINFFTYYFNTLKAANKVPILSPFTSAKNRESCLSIFPPYPIDQKEKIEIKLLSLIDLMSIEEQKEIFNYFRTDPISPQIEKQVAASFSRAVYQLSASRLPVDHPFLNSFDWNQAALKLLRLGKKIDQALLKKMDATLVSVNLKSSSSLMTKEMVEHFISWIDDMIANTQADISQLESILISKQPTLESLAHLATLKKILGDLIRDRKMWLLWSQESLIPSLEGLMISLTLSPQELNLYQERLSGHPRIAGGCGMALVDKTAQSNSLGHTLLEHSTQELANLSPGKLQPISESLQKEIPSGVVFKIAFEDFPLTSDEEKQQSLAYYCPRPSHPILNQQQAEILEAVALEEVDRFMNLAEGIQDWNFQDRLGTPIVHYAASKNHPIFLKIFLNRGILLEQEDALGYTPLHYAARYGSMACLQMLLEQNPLLINRLSSNGETPLYVAVQNGQEACVQVLLKNGADPNLKTPMQMTPLMLAIYRGFEEIALDLIQIPTVDFEEVLQDGSTALHLAAYSQMEKVVRRLCELGADASRARLDGLTPVDIAAKQGWLLGVQLILTSCPYVTSNTIRKK